MVMIQRFVLAVQYWEKKYSGQGVINAGGIGNGIVQGLKEDQVCNKTAICWYEPHTSYMHLRQYRLYVK